MPRTPLLRALRTLFTDAHRARKEDLSLGTVADLREEASAKSLRAREAGGLNRRAFLGAAAAGVVSVAGASREGLAATGKGPSIAVVGGGIAGLTCALRLADRGLASTVYEASGRIGGRMFSNTQTWAEGQVSEWCGELIDTGHETVQALAKRFKLPLDDLRAAEPDGAEDTYSFFGKYYRQSRAEADFLAGVAASVAADADAAGYPTTFDAFTPAGAALDGMSVADWIDARVPGGRRSRLGQLLDVAYAIEYGADTSEQSALNLVYLLGYQPEPDSLELFGESDERYHIRGGNQRLPLAIAQHLGNVQEGYALQRLAQTPAGRYTLSFARAGSTVDVTADFVVLALPFAVLRNLDTRRAGFDSLKNVAIQELGRAHNGKTQLQFARRLWNERGTWPGISNGASYSDTGYQASWEVTRGQAGRQGILNFYSGGSVTDRLSATTPFGTASDKRVADDACRVLKLAEPVFPGLTGAWTGRATQSIPHKSPFFNCSYSYWRVGQYLSFAGYEGVAQGRVLFCGEHTSQSFQGYMEGGASEGLRAAEDIVTAVRGRAAA